MNKPTVLRSPSRHFIRLLSSLALMAALPGNALGQVRLPPPDSLDRFIQEQMEERQIPGLSLAISRNGEIVVARGYGVADVQNGAPVTAETRFDLASVTKQFTAAGIMLLVEEGRIDLDASIRAYLPDAPETWAGITVRHLLNQTSGFPYGGLQDTPVDIPSELWYRAAVDAPLHSAPGVRFRYSDTNYLLLGMITERVSGSSWGDFMAERIFAPLDLNSSYVTDRLRIHRNEARTYDLLGGEVINARRVYRVEPPSHNGIFSNVLDLARWDAALYSDHFLSEESRQAMWDRARLTDGTHHPYGFGWALDRRAGRPVHFHGGAAGTVILRFPQDTLAVIVLTNLSSSGAYGLAMQVGEMMLPDLRNGLPLDAAQARRYVGEYRNERGLTARVLVQGDTLYMIPPRGNRPMPLVYEGDSRFSVGNGNAAVEFMSVHSDSVSGLIVYPENYVSGSIHFNRQ